jgi:hypothetical protein
VAGQSDDGLSYVRNHEWLAGRPAITQRKQGIALRLVRANR